LSDPDRTAEIIAARHQETMLISQAVAIIETVHAFRHHMEPYWKTPTPYDCLRHAFTEIGQAVDAQLRLSRLDETRNKRGRGAVKEKIADALIMVATALHGVKLARPTGLVKADNRLGLAAVDVTIAMLAASSSGLWQNDAFTALYRCIQLLGVHESLDWVHNRLELIYWEKVGEGEHGERLEMPPAEEVLPLRQALGLRACTEHFDKLSTGSVEVALGPKAQGRHWLESPGDGAPVIGRKSR
jgi:hypothetical protein